MLQVIALLPHWFPTRWHYFHKHDIMPTDQSPSRSDFFSLKITWSFSPEHTGHDETLLTIKAHATSLSPLTLPLLLSDPLTLCSASCVFAHCVINSSMLPCLSCLALVLGSHCLSLNAQCCQAKMGRGNRFKIDTVTFQCYCFTW